MGPAYIERAFRRVAAIDKTARLALNEAQCDNDHDWGRSIRPLLKGLVDRLLDAGAPLDTIGLQSHLKPQWPADYRAFADYAADFAKRGLTISITEFDIDNSALPDDFAARDRAVAAVGAEVPRRGPRRPGGRHGRRLAIVGPLFLVSRVPTPPAAPAAVRRRLPPEAAGRGDGGGLRRRAATRPASATVNAVAPRTNRLVTMTLYFQRQFGSGARRAAFTRKSARSMTAWTAPPPRRAGSAAADAGDGAAADGRRRRAGAHRGAAAAACCCPAWRSPPRSRSPMSR